MKTQNLFTMLLILLSFVGLGQNVSTAEVMAVIPLGGQSYSIIHEDGTENYYKTSPHPNNTLFQGGLVEIQFGSDVNLNVIQVVSSHLTDPLFCELISQNIGNDQIMPFLRGIDIGYRRYVGYNSEHNVLVFQTWDDVRSVELLIEESFNNYTYNQGNEEAIFDVINLIRANGWTMSPNLDGNKVSLPRFKEFLDNSYPLGSNVLISLIALDEEEGLNPIFMRDVFAGNLPLSYNTEQRLISSTLAPGIKNHILEANDNFLDAPNHVFNDFIATFPGYHSLYEELNTEELSKLQSGVDPADPNFDRDPVILPFERLIMNAEHEVWIAGHLYKLYENCRAISMQGNVAEAYQDLATLNPDGSPNIPQLNEGPQGLSEDIMDNYVPTEYMIYNPQEFDPLGSAADDPNYNTALQTYNLITGCPISNYTYSLYTTSDLSVDFYNMTDFSDVIQPESSFYHYWTFGDGTGSFQENPKHTYSAFGTYIVRLTTFDADCGCWHVHKYEVELKPLELRDGNPQCPFEDITIDINWAQDPAQIYVLADPAVPVVVVPPNTEVINYKFEIYNSADILIHQVNGVQEWLQYTFAEEGAYYIVITMTWNAGCISESDPHHVTINLPDANPTCCDDKDRPEDKNKKITYNNDEYCLKIKDLARGSWGTESYRKIQGTHKLYVKKQNKTLWKKQPAWHIIEVGGTYWDREQDDSDDQWYCFNPQPFDKAKYTCNNEIYELFTHPGNFPNKFGLDENSITIKHRVYLGGSMVGLPATPHCCDCFNSGGFLLFNEEVKLGKCED